MLRAAPLCGSMGHEKAMTEGPDFTIYREAMIVLATAAVLVPIGQR